MRRALPGCGEGLVVTQGGALGTPLRPRRSPTPACPPLSLCRGFQSPVLATKGAELWLRAEGPIDPLAVQRLEPSIGFALGRVASLAQRAASMDVHIGPKGAAVRLVYAGGATPTPEVGGGWW